MSVISDLDPDQIFWEKLKRDWENEIAGTGPRLERRRRTELEKYLGVEGIPAGVGSSPRGRAAETRRVC